MIRIQNISLPAREDTPQALRSAAARALGVSAGDIEGVFPKKRSIDARRKSDIRIIYTADAAVRGDEERLIRRCRLPAAAAEDFIYEPPVPASRPEHPPVIAGFGPAGMFASLVLAEAGLRPLVLERGPEVDRRVLAVERFWETGRLDPEANVQFGEGGAGAFSDGKLTTNTKNPRIQWVLDAFAGFGADPRVAYEAKPHVGTDRLRVVVKNLRNRVIELGGQVRFNARLTGIMRRNGRVAGVEINGGESLACRHLILAVGHSARDTFRMLERDGYPLEPKPFAMGVRIEHLQRDIDAAQYGDFAGLRALGAADYKLVTHTSLGSVYTFCMCPGGYVVASASEEGGVVTNGMSWSGRAGVNANSALLVGLDPSDFPYSGPLGGVEWQRELERRAFELGGGGYRAPAQYVGDFLGRPGIPAAEPTYRPGVTYCDLHELLPRRMSGAMELALPELDRRLRGFASPGAVMTGPETRSSSPVRLLRGADRQCVGVPGLYPAGEGPGYAGGITSAAVDGMMAAEAIINSL